MHGYTRPDALFPYDSHFELPQLGSDYPSRGYPNSLSDSWNYGVSSPYSSYEGSFTYGGHKHSRHWSGDFILESPMIPRNFNSYDVSLRNVDIRHSPLYSPNMNLWPSSQLSPQWSDSEISDTAAREPWSNMVFPDEPSERKPIVHSIGSCSPHSTVSSLSPSPSPLPGPLPSPPSATTKPGRRSSTAKGAQKMCAHCHAVSTPLWRREPSTLRTLCNACGLYLQQRNKLRPQELIDADNDDDSDSSEQNRTGPECSHCHTRNTSVWRRSKTGAQLCNACGVYARLRGKDRPLSLKRNKIKPRTKHAKH